MSYQVARTLGIDNIVETHLAFADKTPGAMMRKVHGETVEDWLISRGYYERSGFAHNYPKEELTRLMYSKDDRDRGLYKRILWHAFGQAVIEMHLGDDWEQLKCVDFITGQADRSKLSNMMICVQNGRLRLVGIDNDLYFPINNGNASLAPPHKSGVISSVHNPGLCERMVSVMQPEAFSAFKERVDAAQKRRFMEKEEAEVNMKIGPEADFAAEGFGSGSGSGGRGGNKQIPHSAPNVDLFSRRENRHRRHCTLL